MSETPPIGEPAFIYEHVVRTVVYSNPCYHTYFHKPQGGDGNPLTLTQVQDWIALAWQGEPNWAGDQTGDMLLWKYRRLWHGGEDAWVSVERPLLCNHQAGSPSLHPMLAVVISRAGEDRVPPFKGRVFIPGRALFGGLFSTHGEYGPSQPWLYAPSGGFACLYNQQIYPGSPATLPICVCYSAKLRDWTNVRWLRFNNRLGVQRRRGDIAKPTGLFP